jgi:AMP deaminase
MSNLQPTAEVPQTPKSFQATPGSPVASTSTEQAQHFSSLPPGALSGPLGPVHLARQNQSTTDLTIQPASPTSTKGSTALDRPSRTSSTTVNVPQPASPQQQQYFQEGEALGLTRTTSSVNMDGEPRIFPGVVSRSARRSSVMSRGVEDGAYVGFRKGGGGVQEGREEVDTDAEE